MLEAYKLLGGTYIYKLIAMRVPELSEYPAAKSVF
jgi:hypothetical protein